MSRQTIDALTAQKGLAVRHNETRGLVSHPSVPDGVWGRWSEASLRSWFRNDAAGRMARDTGVVSVADTDGRVRHISVDAYVANMLQAASMDYSASRHRRPIAPTTTSMPDPVPAVDPSPAGAWYPEGSMDLDPEPEPIPHGAPPASGPVLPVPGAAVPALTRRAEAPVWPWLVGGVAVVAVVGFVAWKSG